MLKSKHELTNEEKCLKRKDWNKLEKIQQFKSYSQTDLHKSDKISISQLLKENRPFPGLEIDSDFGSNSQKQLVTSK